MITNCATMLSQKTLTTRGGVMPFKIDEELSAALMKHVEKEKQAGKEMFMGLPDHWYEPPRWRCKNDHISGMYLKSEAIGGNVCLECHAFVHLTFPEDKDGPLKEVE